MADQRDTRRDNARRTFDGWDENGGPTPPFVHLHNGSVVVGTDVPPGAEFDPTTGAIIYGRQ